MSIKQKVWKYLNLLRKWSCMRNFLLRFFRARTIGLNRIKDIKTNRRYGTLKLENDLWTKGSTVVKMQRVYFGCEITIFL